MPSNSLMQRIMATRALKLKDGRLRIWGIPAAIYSLFSMCYMTRLLEMGYGGPDLFYWAGFYQAQAATNTMLKRFGYKKKVLQAMAEQSGMLGLGLAESVVISLKKKIFMFRRKSELPQEYMKEYGRQKVPVCHFFRGLSAGVISALFPEEDFLAVETNCMVCGKSTCDVVVKPRKEWNPTDKLVMNQIPKKLPSPQDLGYKRLSEELPQRTV